MRVRFDFLVGLSLFQPFTFQPHITCELKTIFLLLCKFCAKQNCEESDVIGHWNMWLERMFWLVIVCACTLKIVSVFGTFLVLKWCSMREMCVCFTHMKNTHNKILLEHYIFEQCYVGAPFSVRATKKKYIFHV